MKNLSSLLFTLGTFTLIPGVSAASSPLPDNLSDETCRAEVREEIARQPGLPRDLQVLCNDARIGSMFAFTAGPGINNAASLLKFTFEDNLQGMALARRMSCERFHEIESGATVLAIAGCRLINGGWPHTIAISLRENTVRLAEGPPTTIPALIEVVATGRPVQSKSEWTDLLQSAFGEAIPLVSPRELRLFSELVRSAQAANAQGRHADSEQLLRQALILQSRLLGERNPATANTVMDLALILSNRGRNEEAEALFARADAVIQKSPRESDRARLFTYYGFHAANQGKYADALIAADNAVRAWRRQLAGPLSPVNTLLTVSEDYAPDHQERGELGVALNLLANMALRLEDTSTASAAAIEALSLFTDTKGIPQWWRADALLTLGKISSAQGRLSAAETYLNTALKQRRLVKGDGPHTIEVLVALGAAYQREGLLTSSIITYREVLSLLRKFPDSAQDTLRADDLVPFARALTEYAKTLKDTRQVQSLFAEAFDAFKLIRPTNVEQTIAQTAARLASDNAGLQALLDSASQAQRRRDTANLELSFETSLPSEQRSRIVEDRLAEEIRQSDSELRRITAQLDKEFPDYGTLIKPKTLVLSEVQQKLGPREGLITFMLGRQHSFVTLIRRDGIHIGAINEGERFLSSTVTSLRRALEIQAGSVSDYDLDLAHQLYQSLFGEIEAQLVGLDHLIIAPSGPLASLPFSILVTKPAASARYSQAAWLVDRSSISHVPSLQAFFTLRTSERVRQPSQKILALGNPVLTGKPSGTAANTATSALATSCRTAGPAPADLISSLAPLPDTALELRSVARALGANANDSLLLAQNASEKAFRSRNIADYRILYFATHGLLPGELKCQAEPALVLTPPGQSTERTNDGLLEASEIATLKINADLVVLSACNTAGGGGRFGGDALSGLAESFFFAGARNLLVSHWQVPSAATTQLMSQVFDVIGPDLERGSSSALQVAQKKMITNEKTAHPFFWGAFVLIGDGVAKGRL